MRFVFSQNKTMEQCFDEALTHIQTAKRNGSHAVTGLSQLGFRRRVTQYAVMFYMGNWAKLDHINCQLRADHYGVGIGDTIKRPVNSNELEISEQASLLKSARDISLKRDMATFV